MNFHSKPVQPSGERKVLTFTRNGVTIKRERPAVSGGYYVRDLMTFPWPWKKES